MHSSSKYGHWHCCPKWNGRRRLFLWCTSSDSHYLHTNYLLFLSPLGTRLMGGKDAASPRYVFTKLEVRLPGTFYRNSDLLRCIEQTSKMLFYQYFALWMIHHHIGYGINSATTGAFITNTGLHSPWINISISPDYHSVHLPPTRWPPAQLPGRWWYLQSTISCDMLCMSLACPWWQNFRST